MPLVIARQNRQGIKLSINGTTVWIYLKHKADRCGHMKASVIIDAPSTVLIDREEVLEEKGPLFDDRAYEKGWAGT